MDYLNRLFTIILILYKDSDYQDKFMLTLFALELLNKEKINICSNCKSTNKNFKINYLSKGNVSNIKRVANNTGKKIYIKKIKNNHATRVNTSLEKAMELYKERYNKKKNNKKKSVLVSTLKQNMKNDYVIVENNIKNIDDNKENNKKIIKAPVLVLSLDILENFKGKIWFSKPIKLIDNITNKIIIKDKVAIIGANNNLTIFIEGYLETCIDCVEITNNKFYSYVLNTPFSSIKHINQVHHKINNKSDYNKLNIEILNSRQEVNKNLKKSTNGYGYDECALIININFSVNIFKNDLITI